MVHWSEDRALKDDLETLAGLLSHAIRKADLAAVLHEAVRCGIEKHGKRKGAVKPERKSGQRPAPRNPTVVSAEVRRQVWERDGGRCAWRSPEGKRCGSRWQLEVDHEEAAARGGTATLDNLRLACRGHNFRHAEETFGAEHMKKYRKGEFIDPGGSGLPPPGGGGRLVRPAGFARAELARLASPAAAPVVAWARYGERFRGSRSPRRTEQLRWNGRAGKM